MTSSASNTDCDVILPGGGAPDHGAGMIEVGLQQATVVIRAQVPIAVLRDTIKPFPSFSESVAAALKALDLGIRGPRRPTSEDVRPVDEGLAMSPSRGA